jgi:riboflavin kinase/FMN adenylyltransferase
MRIVRGPEPFPPDLPPGVVALGVFDGVHLGHRAILGHAVTAARAQGLAAVACTFSPHPLEVLQPARAPAPITTLEERLALVAETGLDTTVVLAFTPALAAMEPEAFVKDILLDRLHAREIVVGFNHRFGRGARGDARLLQTLAERLGFRAHVVPPLSLDGVPVSSTEIRAALQRADLATAARCLGRDYAVAGEVVAGAGRGRTLGFPTANVRVSRPVLVPSGVYACRVGIDAQPARPAVVNLGVRPTFGGEAFAVEAYLLDFAGDLYGARVNVAFVARLREERRFPSVEALVEQIARDVEAARRAL